MAQIKHSINASGIEARHKTKEVVKVSADEEMFERIRARSGLKRVREDLESIGEDHNPKRHHGVHMKVPGASPNSSPTSSQNPDENSEDEEEEGGEEEEEKEKTLETATDAAHAESKVTEQTQ